MSGRCNAYSAFCFGPVCSTPLIDFKNLLKQAKESLFNVGVMALTALQEEKKRKAVSVAVAISLMWFSMTKRAFPKSFWMRSLPAGWSRLVPHVSGHAEVAFVDESCSHCGKRDEGFLGMRIQLHCFLLGLWQFLSQTRG